MASPKQRVANQLNGLRSKGPKTESGKRRSAVNATRHGLTIQIDASIWAPLLEPLTELLIRDGFSELEARNIARHILDYERNVQYQRERFGLAKEDGEPATGADAAGEEELALASALKNIAKTIDARLLQKHLGFDKDGTIELSKFFRQLGNRKIREAERDARQTLRNADRHLRRAANQLVRHLVS
jgi:hypothetical protein